MPKMKTHKGAAKRFKVTGTGKVTHKCPLRNHMMAAKSPAKKRSKRSGAIVDKTDMERVHRMMPYA